VGFAAAQLALPFWLRANPEKSYQAPLIAALEAVERYCATGELAPDGKAIAEQAYKAVGSSDLPSGDIHRSSGFSIAHIAMAPWLLSSGNSSQAWHNAKVAINYSESIHSWAGKLVELEAALESRRQGLRDA
jgi:hypothetical protein